MFSIEHLVCNFSSWKLFLSGFYIYFIYSSFPWGLLRQLPTLQIHKLTMAVEVLLKFSVFFYLQLIWNSFVFSSWNSGRYMLEPPQTFSISHFISLCFWTLSELFVLFYITLILCVNLEFILFVEFLYQWLHFFISKISNCFSFVSTYTF